MGKYNFSSQRLAELESRLLALEQANNELRKENAQLRKEKTPAKSRCLLKDINNAEKAKELFGLDCKDGKLIKAETERRTEVNLGVFYQNLFRALNPTVYVSPKDGRNRIVYTKIQDLTDLEYKIHVETLEACIDTIYYAKRKLKGNDD